MITAVKTINFTNHDYDYIKLLAAENLVRSVSDILFFDIETTGFKAETSFLYLIGCLYFEGEHLVLSQFLAEDLMEEAKLIDSFFSLLETHSSLVHFNGTTFDLPYISRKCAMLNIANKLEGITSLDLYKHVRGFKKLYGLNSMKQKSLEVFCQVNRLDRFDGGELIDVYKDYLVQNKMRQEAAAGERLKVLLLHNYEDVSGMVSILKALFLTTLKEGLFTVDKVSEEFGSLNIDISFAYEAPCEFSHISEDRLWSITVSHDSAAIHLKIIEDELKLFFPNYRDYFYLPSENRIIHKSLGAFIDRELREKATSENCFEPRTDRFVLAPKGASKYEFSKTSKDKQKFMPCSLIQKDDSSNEAYEYAKAFFQMIME